MKIQLITGAYPPVRCGVGDYTRRLGEQLASLRQDVYLLTSVSPEIALSNSPVKIAPVIPTWTIGSFPAITAYLRSTKPDIINVQYPTQGYTRQPVPNLIPLLGRGLLHTPVVTTIHEYLTFRRLGRIRIGLSIFLSNRIIVTDPLNLKALQQDFPRASQRMEWIPIASSIDPPTQPEESRRQVRARFGIDETERVLAYYGFLSPTKGVEFLLQALEALYHQRPESRTRLLLIADRQPASPDYAIYHHQVEALLEQMTHKDRVIWTGYLSNQQVSAHLSAADLAVLPFTDGASLRRSTLHSALAHGLPTLTTLGPSTKAEGLGTDQGMVLVPARDPRALAEALLRFEQDPQELQSLSSNARRFASRFTWPEIANQTLQVYQRAIKPKGGG